MAVFLIDEKSGARINLGDAAKTFRGEPMVVRGHARVSQPGRGYVEFEDGHMASYYLSVINAKVVVG